MQTCLFVCTGNICRSPMAEGMLRVALGRTCPDAGPAIDSAGTQAIPGRPPEPNAVEVAARYGADISELRSRPFEREDYARFSHIIALDAGHLDLLNFMRPDDYHGTIMLLPGAQGSHAVEVPDPYGCGVERYLEAARLIAAGISALLGSEDESLRPVPR